jgi:aerobic-type carbon monoxide dehydrogenase small subunit (CoxS/CutS family)
MIKKEVMQPGKKNNRNQAQINVRKIMKELKMAKEEKSREEQHGKLSRREFLKDAGLIVGGATVGSMSILSACKGGDATATITKTTTVTAPGGAGGGTTTVTVTATPGGAASNTISLTINGQSYAGVEVKTGQTLLSYLHDTLGLTGAKYFCDQGACGACSVIMNGRPVLSCTTLTVECDGANIQTVEGIAAAKHPLIDAYIENNCMQCGYCTPGFVVTAKALLDRKPKATEADIRDALAGNLCRCGTYPQHILAILEAEKKL